MATIILDLVGLKCPWPAIRTKKALATLKIGDVLNVRCSDPMAAIDIPHLVNVSGHRLLESGRDADDLLFRIEKQSI